MFFAVVTPLMRKGLRLRKHERERPLRVMVTILESDRDRNNSARNLTEVRLYVSYGISQMAGRGLITDPVIRPYKGPGFLIEGTELETEMVDGECRIREHRQVWHILPVERRGDE